MIEDSQYPQAAKALHTALGAHSGQVDLTGEEYIGHLSRVAVRVLRSYHLWGEQANDEVVAAAMLHDILEDTPMSVHQLLGKGFTERTVQLVNLLTRTSGVGTYDYYRFIRSDPDALRIKLADIADNMEPVRLAKLQAPVRAGLVGKYTAALKELLA